MRKNLTKRAWKKGAAVLLAGVLTAGFCAAAYGSSTVTYIYEPGDSVNTSYRIHNEEGMFSDDTKYSSTFDAMWQYKADRVASEGIVEVFNAKKGWLGYTKDTTRRQYISKNDAGKTFSATIEDRPAGTYYFAMGADSLTGLDLHVSHIVLRTTDQ